MGDSSVGIHNIKIQHKGKIILDISVIICYIVYREKKMSEETRVCCEEFNLLRRLDYIWWDVEGWRVQLMALYEREHALKLTYCPVCGNKLRRLTIEEVNNGGATPDVPAKLRGK